MGEQLVSERLQPGLAGDLGLGPALRLVRQVDVLQPGLGVGGHDARGQLVVELALGADRLQDGRPPLVQLAQVAQPLLQRAQLRVVQGAGRLLAVPGDERHRGPAVEQLDRRADLPLPHSEFLGDPALDSGGGGRLRGGGGGCGHDGLCLPCGGPGVRTIW